MNFATLTYAVFLLAVVVAYWSTPRWLGRWLLIAASLVFYATWNPRYLPGFGALIVANWALGLLAARPGRARPAVVATVVLDLGVLLVFKYLGWSMDSSNWLLSRVLGRSVDLPVPDLVLPLAISFVTFTMLAYVIDIARGHAPERRLTRFALFVLFFPHLIAGPIMRADEFLPQVNDPPRFRWEHVRYALPLLVIGLLKKSIADQLAPYVNQAFADPSTQSRTGLWRGALAISFQILFDFSGYTDLALGSAGLLGYRLPINFNWPYRATSVQDFWRRWHMTLSRWLRDYLYIALGGSRHGPARTYLALAATMLLGGLWHGAGLTFVVWGAWHGLGLAAHRWYRQRWPGARLPGPVAWATTFLFVLVGWVFFRADSMSLAFDYLGGMVTADPGGSAVPGVVALLLLVGLLGLWPRWSAIAQWVAPAGSARAYAAYGTLAVFAVFLVPQVTPDFIYFQF